MYGITYQLIVYRLVVLHPEFLRASNICLDRSSYKWTIIKTADCKYINLSIA